MTDDRVVVVGIDGSETSSDALRWAAGEAARRDASLRVVHSYSIPVYGGEMGFVAVAAVDIESFEATHATLVAEQIAPITASFPGLTIETRLTSGPGAIAIVEAAVGAELTVVGSRGAGALASAILGSVAHSVVHHASGPVVLVPHPATAEAPQRIVVGTDGSPAASAAVAWAKREADLWGVELTVIHCWDYPYVGPRTGTVEPAELMELDAATVLTTAVDRLKIDGAQLHGVHAKLTRGAAASALVDSVGPADLLVVGARGRGALRAALLGSTSNQIIHHATCPVTIVHAD